MAPRLNIYMAASVHDAVALAARRGAREGVEFGGSLLAVQRGDDLVLAYAIPTGSGADQSAGHVRTDAEFQNLAIARVMERVPEARYVGDWHVHPMGCEELSTTDLSTAQSMLEDDDVPLERLVLVLGIPQRSGGARVRTFFATSGAGALARIASTYPELVEDDGPRVRAVLDGALPRLEDILDGPDGSAVRREADCDEAEGAGPEELGRAESSRLARRARRIAEDLAEIEEELGAEVELREGGELLGAVVRRGRRAVVVVFPPEYPSGAPHVLRGGLQSAGGGLVPLRYGWSSLHRLCDVVEAGLAGGGWTDTNREGPPGVPCDAEADRDHGAATGRAPHGRSDEEGGYARPRLRVRSLMRLLPWPRASKRGERTPPGLGEEGT